jgi:hypothetical protein
MRVAEKYKLSRTQLLSTWTLEDVFDALEFMEINSAVEQAQSKHHEERSK